MTCRELIELLDAYVAGEVPEQRLLLCEQHLAICASCRAYLHSYRTTVALGKAAFGDPDASVPTEIPEDLIRALLALRPRDGSSG